MKLVLLRHADAEPELAGPLGFGDHGRALTGLGRQQARDTARWLGVAAASTPRQIWTSPLVRAVQTAEILAHVWTEALVAVAEPLACGRALERQLVLVRELPAVEVAALVGHEPQLSDLAAALLGLRCFPLPFEKGAALLLRRSDGGFTFEAYRRPMGEALLTLPSK